MSTEHIYLVIIGMLTCTTMFGYYVVHAFQENLIPLAIKELESSLKQFNVTLNNSDDAINYLILKLSGYTNEVFAVMYLNSELKLIEYREHFVGTINRTKVYPRIIAEAALELSAHSIILVHNHPNCTVPTPSAEDADITNMLKDALSVFDIEVIDHILISGLKGISIGDNPPNQIIPED